MRKIILLVSIGLLYFNSTLLSAKKHIPCFINGNMYANKGEYKKALEWYEKGIDKNITDCIINAAAIYIDERKGIPKKPNFGFILLKKAVKLEPYDSFIHYNLGVYYYNLGIDKTISQRNITDIKAKYHFIFAYLLGKKDATNFVRVLYKIKRKNGFLDDVLKNKHFDKKLIETRLEKFSHKKIKNFNIRVEDNKIIFYAQLNILNSRSFGEYIELIQHVLYLDIPNNVASKTQEALSKLKSSFSHGILIHNFSLNTSKKFTYSVEIMK